MLLGDRIAWGLREPMGKRKENARFIVTITAFLLGGISNAIINKTNIMSDATLHFDFFSKYFLIRSFIEIFVTTIN